MKLYAARHGETTWNVEKRILGNAPGELTQKGRGQARELAIRVSELKIRAAYASDLQRVVETTEIVKKEVPELGVIYTPALRERDFGTLEGELMADVDWDGFWALPSKESLYGAESLYVFTGRVAQFILQLKADMTEDTMLFSHIGVMNRLNYLSKPSGFTFVNYSNADAVVFDLNVLTENSHAFLDGSLNL